MKCEYKIERVADGIAEKKLNELAKQGWELVTATIQGSLVSLYLKRPIAQ